MSKKYEYPEDYEIEIEFDCLDIESFSFNKIDPDNPQVSFSAKIKFSQFLKSIDEEDKVEIYQCFKALYNKQTLDLIENKQTLKFIKDKIRQEMCETTSPLRRLYNETDFSKYYMWQEFGDHKYDNRYLEFTEERFKEFLRFVSFEDDE